MKLEFFNESQQVVLKDDALVFALDETGHEKFKDDKYKVFGIGGCAFLVRNFLQFIHDPWEKLYSEHLSNFARPIHMANIANSLTDAQRGEIDLFFLKSNFFRLATIIPSHVKNNTSLPIINFAVAHVYKQIENIANKIGNLDEVFILIEQSDRLGKELNILFPQYGLSNLKCNIGLIPKKLSMSAMEIADIVVRTAGRQVNYRASGKTNVLHDFQTIFQTNYDLKEFKEITRIEPQI